MALVNAYTYAILDVSPATYREIREKLDAAGYQHAFHRDGGREVIDMHGIALSGPTRTCAANECVNTFTPSDPRQKYCSPECGTRSRWRRYAPTRVRDYQAEYSRRKKR